MRLSYKKVISLEGDFLLLPHMKNYIIISIIVISNIIQFLHK